MDLNGVFIEYLHCPKAMTNLYYLLQNMDYDDLQMHIKSNLNYLQLDATVSFILLKSNGWQPSRAPKNRTTPTRS